MDARRRWATVRNERMGIVLEVTHTDDGGCRERDGQKAPWRAVCDINLSSLASGSKLPTVQAKPEPKVAQVLKDLTQAAG